MEATVISDLIESAVSVINQVAQVDSQVGSPSVGRGIRPSYPLKIGINVVGDIEGAIVYSMDGETAKRVASAMMFGMSITEVDIMVMSAIMELANIITGSASTIFETRGISVDITPPIILEGPADIPFNDIQAVTIPLKIPIDSNTDVLEINAALQDR
ncbi:MAG: chemotaxis protein CheX [bacterium]